MEAHMHWRVSQGCPSIVQVLDVYENELEPGIVRIYLVMEWLVV
jgi:hypothetical protein